MCLGGDGGLHLFGTSAGWWCFFFSRVALGWVFNIHIDLERGSLLFWQAPSKLQIIIRCVACKGIGLCLPVTSLEDLRRSNSSATARIAERLSLPGIIKRCTCSKCSLEERTKKKKSATTSMNKCHGLLAVSYTHLTLPTICSV